MTHSLLINCAGIRSVLQEKGKRITVEKGSNVTTLGKYLTSLLMLDQG